MRAVFITKPGGPEVLELRETPDLEPGPGEVRVRVHASGLNRADLLQRRGLYPAPQGAPQDIPGLEVAGVVDRIGPGVSGFQPGDRVMAVVPGGGYAEQALVPAAELLPIPERLGLTEAAAVPEAFATAFDALVLQAGLRAGETVLVHAAGSGVGTAAVQIARAAGAHCAGTSRTPDKLDRAAALGLERAIGADGWVDEALRWTSGRGVDVVLDLVGGGYVEGDLRVLAPLGRIVVVGLMGGASATLPLGLLLQRRARILGTVLRTRPPVERAALATELRSRVIPLLEAGRLRPIVDEVVPALRVAEAHARMEQNRTFGKVVLQWPEGEEAQPV